MKRVSALVVGLAILSLVPAVAGAQGFGFPGFGCGTSCDPERNLGAPGFYLGYMKMDKGYEGSISYKDIPLVAVQGRTRHPLRGLWLGASYAMPFSETVAVIASGWYLLAENSTASESYGFGAIPSDFFPRDWTAKNQWYYGDALAAVGDVCGFSLLGGLRYEYYDTHYQDPTDKGSGVWIGSTDEADLTSQAWIPLLGAQYSTCGGEGSFLIRVVGIPTIIGTAKYRETASAVMGGARIDGSGNYKAGGFLEVFTEFNKKLGNAEAGLFVRYNATSAKADLNVDIIPPGGVAFSNGTYDGSFYRSTWTIGGKVGLSF